MARQVGSAYVEFSANTGKVVSGMEQAKAAARAASRQMKADIKEAQGTMALLGEEVGVKLPRHLRTFVAKLPGVAEAMSAAFSGAAVIGLGMIVVEQAKKMYEALQKIAEAPKKIAEEFEKEKDSIASSNDELIKQNTELQNAIDKFKGVPENKLASQLAEATVQAVKLGQSLLKVDEEIQKILNDNKVSLFAKLMGVAGMDDIQKKVVEFQSNQLAITEQYDEKIRAARAAGNKADLDAQVKAKHDALAQSLADEKQYIEQQQTAAETAKAQYDATQKKVFAGAFSFQQDPATRLSALVGIHGDLNESIQNLNLGYQNLQLNEEKAGETGLSAAERLKKAQDEAYRDMRAMIAEDTANKEANQRITDALTETWVAAEKQDQAEAKHTAELEKQHTAEYIADQKEKLDAALAVEKTAQENADLTFKMDQISEQKKVQMGEESNAERIANTRDELDERYAAIQESLAKELALYEGDAVKQDEVRREALKAAAEYAEQTASLQRDALNEGIGGALDDLVQKAMNISQEMRSIFTNMISGINDQLVNMMSGKRTSFGQMFSGVASQVAKTGLSAAEGMVLKAFNVPGKLDGSSSAKAIWTRSADNIKKAGTDIASLAKGSPDPSTNSDSTGGLLHGIFSTIVSALIPHASGGPVIPGAAYLVGERGPEPFFPGVSGSMGTNAAMRRAFGNGNVSHNVSVDARGSSDPAAVTAAVHRAMRSYLPSFVVASSAYQHDMKQRMPAMKAGGI